MSSNEIDYNTAFSDCDGGTRLRQENANEISSYADISASERGSGRQLAQDKLYKMRLSKWAGQGSPMWFRTQRLPGRRGTPGSMSANPPRPLAEGECADPGPSQTHKRDQGPRGPHEAALGDATARPRHPGVSAGLVQDLKNLRAPAVGISVNPGFGILQLGYLDQ